MNDFDVLIIGGGGAGLAAGIMARKAGATCMVLEADTKLGGATWLSGGVVYAAGTSVQRATGIENDTADDMYNYFATLSGWEITPYITRILCDQSAGVIEWLISLGVEFPPEYLLCSGVDTVPRGHPAKGAGMSIAQALINEAGAAGVEHALGTRVDKLLVENGKVVGISADGTELRAAATLITTGGFGNSPEMIKRLFPTAAYHGDWTYAVHMDAPFILGDGVTLGESVGADIVGHDTGLLNPTSGFGKFVEAFLPPWVMMVNNKGQRFMDESSAYAVSGYLLNAQPEKRAWVIFDEPTLDVASQDLRFADPYHSGSAMPTWEHGMIRNKIASGDVMQADSLEELAGKIGIDSEALGNTVKQYNAGCDEGRDSKFFKEMDTWFPVKQPPFYAREVRACVIGQTGAGLNINEHAQVLDVHGKVIPGLYAAGEVLGCAMGKRYSGGGSGLLNAMVFGRIAGTAAAGAAGQ